MRRISDVAGLELNWVQPSARKHAYDLRAADQVVATLAWRRASLADGATADGRWTFKREGFWHPRVTVRAPDSDLNEAVFRPNWAGGGSLEITGGQFFRLGAANFWHSAWDWQDPQGGALVHFKSRHGFLKSGAQVEIAPEAVDLPQLSLLVVLGWYLLVLFARDAAAAGGGGAIVAATG